MWEDRDGKKVLRVNEVDLLVGVILGLGGTSGVTKQRLRRAVSWMTPLQLQTAVSIAIRRGLIREQGTKYQVRLEEAVAEDRPRHSEQVPPRSRLLNDVQDIYGVPNPLKK